MKKKYIEFTVGELLVAIACTIGFAAFLALWLNGCLSHYGVVAN